jgi:glycosyltransferase involved in cell wall biosynthesis
LTDLFKDKEGFDLSTLYWQHAPRTGELLSWHLVTFGAGGKYGKIDYDRKTLVQRPRERLSACLIVKNEEAHLKRCLDSLLDIADEIIVADTGSTDKTAEVVVPYLEHGLRFTTAPDPLEVGFEAARNASIKDARGEWVLWVDADEVLKNAANLPKYLRPLSQWSGLRIRQHHFSCEQFLGEGFYQVDRPIRVFRTGLGVRFFGVVHEHPETELNKSIEPSWELPDVDLAHGGYLTESERKVKFWRNFPLILKDREKYPERILGKYLYMRDLVHLAVMEYNESGQQLTAKSITYCEEVVNLYRSNFLSAGGHMMVDGLKYYINALSLLGRGNDYFFAVNVGNGNVAPEAPRKARFETPADFLKFVEKDVEIRHWLYEGPWGVR